MSRPGGTHRAVSIEPEQAACCDAVRELLGTRYLCHDAPMLPLTNCLRRDQCRCKYKHWSDRRQEDRRELKSGIASQYFNGEERRANADRRSD